MEHESGAGRCESEQFNSRKSTEQEWQELEAEYAAWVAEHGDPDDAPPLSPEEQALVDEADRQSTILFQVEMRDWSARVHERLATAGASSPAPAQPNRLPSNHHGKLMVLAVGGFGMNLASRLLCQLLSVGFERLVGSILVVKADARERERFLERVPAIFHSR